MNFGRGDWKTFREGIKREWVITNGNGSYAGTSIIGAHARKHHGLLIASLLAPIQRMLILSKINECLTINSHIYNLATNQRPGAFHEEGQRYLQRFSYDTLPHFTYYAEGTFLKKTIALDYEKNTVAIGYDITSGPQGVSLSLTPLFNYRNHGDISKKEDLVFTTSQSEHMLQLIPQENSALTISFYASDGVFIKRKQTIDNPLELQIEIETGMSCFDQNFMPYDILVEIEPNTHKQISILCSLEDTFPKNAFSIIKEQEIRIEKTIDQAGFSDPFARMLVQSADWFLVNRASTGNKTILAGLPWFTDWGRDTMIAMQGLTLVTKRSEYTKGILKTFASYIKNGLVPNMFPDSGNSPLYNTVDASLWFFYSVDKYLSYNGNSEAYSFVETELYPKLEEIIICYMQGTDFSIHMDVDSLISAGSGIDQVTWMDVRVGDWVVTPRHGKPVEINALWYNALKVMEKLANHYGKDATNYRNLAEKVRISFLNIFWNQEKNCLFDVVSDEDKDDKIRPNQIWAISLPHTMLPPEKAKLVVSTVYSHLYMGYGLRSLSPLDPSYRGEYYGSLHKRDAAYHQGTAWAFPLGAFITAYIKVYGPSKETISFAKQLLSPLEDHMRDGCIGTIAEIFDGDEPHSSRGCYAQAWSVGEILRAYAEDILPYLSQ
jgi:predicted glycogen debranching enzyme